MIAELEKASRTVRRVNERRYSPPTHRMCLRCGKPIVRPHDRVSRYGGASNMGAGFIQTHSGGISVKNGGIVVAAPTDPCCCAVDCCVASSGVTQPSAVISGTGGHVDGIHCFADGTIPNKLPSGGGTNSCDFNFQLIDPLGSYNVNMQLQQNSIGNLQLFISLFLSSAGAVVKAWFKTTYTYADITCVAGVMTGTVVVPNDTSVFPLAGPCVGNTTAATVTFG